MTQTNLLITPISAIAQSNRKFDALIRLQAAERGAVHTKPSLNLAIVLDRSGSMSGRPFEEAKMAALDLVQMLDKDDRVSVIVYESNVKVVLESVPAEEAKKVLPGLLRSIRTLGMTALHGGWLMGAKTIADFVKQYAINRIILLSDGQANVGLQDPGLLELESDKLFKTGISTSTYGLGRNFNEDLMTKIAVGGNAFYAETSDALAPNFRLEFDLLSQTVGSNVRIKINATDSDGKTVDVRILNFVTADEQGFFKAGNLIAGSESWLAVEVDGNSSDFIKLTAKATWLNENKEESNMSAETVIILKDQASAEDELVVERAREARAARLQIQAREEMLKGEREKASQIIMHLDSIAGSNVYVQSVVQSLRSIWEKGDTNAFAKEALYAANAMSTRTMRASESADMIGSYAGDVRKASQGSANWTGKTPNSKK